MKISELIEKLTAIREKHGELDVCYVQKDNFQYGTGTWDVDCKQKDVKGVEVRPVYGKHPKVIRKIVELDEY